MKKIIKIVQGVIGLYLFLGIILAMYAGIIIFPVDLKGNTPFAVFSIALVSLALALNLLKLKHGKRCECGCNHGKK